MAKQKKFYETDEFLRIQDEWNSKLEESGFEDIEKADKKGIIQPQIFVSDKPRLIGDIDYYEFCQNILRDFDFRRDIDRFIFECHTEGMPDSEIVSAVEKHSYKTLTKRRVNQIIKETKLSYLSKKQ